MHTCLPVSRAEPEARIAELEGAVARERAEKEAMRGGSPAPRDRPEFVEPVHPTVRHTAEETVAANAACGQSGGAVMIATGEGRPGKALSEALAPVGGLPRVAGERGAHVDKDRQSDRVNCLRSAEEPVFARLTLFGMQRGWHRPARRVQGRRECRAASRSSA